MAYWSGLAATGYWNFPFDGEPASGAAPALHIAARRIRPSAPAQAASVVASVRSISPPKSRFGHLESTPAIGNAFRYGPYDYGRYANMSAYGRYGWPRCGPYDGYYGFARVGMEPTYSARKSWMTAGAVCDMSAAQAKFNELDTNQNGYLEGEELIKLAEWVFDAFHPKDKMTDYQKATETSKLLIRLDQNHDGKMDFGEFEAWFNRTSDAMQRFANRKSK